MNVILFDSPTIRQDLLPFTFIEQWRISGLAYLLSQKNGESVFISNHQNPTLSLLVEGENTLAIQVHPRIDLTVDTTPINVSPTRQSFRLRGQLKKGKRNFDLFTRRVLTPWRSFRSADSSVGQLIKGYLKS
jgi:hypothetical protein